MTPEFIVVHNTANDASAANEIKYMKNNNEKVSYHYAVDDKEIIQGIPEDRNAWHAGDGNGNRKGIAIEICYSKSGGDRFIQAEKNAAEFIAEKLKEKGWGIDKVKKHQDFANKYCPHRTLDMGWTDYCDCKNGIGTENQGKRLEAIQFKATNDLQIQYRVHMQDIGWQEWKNNDEVAGTTGESRRIEAIEIKSNKILEVQEHIENIGWLPASKETEIHIGTVGKALRLEAFKINIL